MPACKVAWAAVGRLCRLLLADAVQVVFAADYEVVTDDRGGGVDRLVDGVRGQDFNFRAVLGDDGRAFTAAPIDAAGGGDGRRVDRIHLGQTFAVDDQFAG